MFTTKNSQIKNEQTRLLVETCFQWKQVENELNRPFSHNSVITLLKRVNDGGWKICYADNALTRLACTKSQNTGKIAKIRAKYGRFCQNARIYGHARINTGDFFTLETLFGAGKGSQFSAGPTSRQGRATCENSTNLPHFEHFDPKTPFLKPVLHSENNGFHGDEPLQWTFVKTPFVKPFVKIPPLLNLL